MDHASITVALWFTTSVLLFAALTAFLVYDQARGDARRVARAGPAYGSTPPLPTRRTISRTRLMIVAITFCVWSLLFADHLRARR